jgi:tubulin monoglycylase TTLL3/8
LLERGWLENPDVRSRLFDLKWAAKTKDIDFENIDDRQLINHFALNGCLTTKYGLCKSLRSMIYNHGVDVFDFYPRCYDLSDLSDFENFLENYKLTYCESILKKFVADPQSYKRS